ncbi:MAG: magnesium transporter [Candidatus Heimdallarchaeota archaeon]|nr:magnesium transporter [Candidatus Heimdallarchaeota archaeon]MCK4954969.1 magnesium transporter [Candidatus Heimdallarchaeota archaeon]
MIKRRSPISMFAGFTLSVLGAIVFNIGGLFAGRTAVLVQNLQDFLPWVILIYPLLLTVRGDINGILTGKLGTALHLGTILPTWRKNTNRFVQLVGLIFLLSFYDSILVGLVASTVGLLLGISISFLQIIVISVTTFIFGTLVSITLTFTLTFWIYKNKGDPDVYAYPIMSSINDIIITVTFFLVCWFYRPWIANMKLDYYVGIPFIVVVFLLALIFFVKNKKEAYIKDGVFQAFPTLTLTNLIAAATGTILASFLGILEQPQMLLVFYPAVISTVGAQGSILANTTTTKLHLGTIKPSFSFYKSSDFLIQISGIIAAGFIMSTVFSVLGTLILPEGFSFPIYLKFLFILIITNLLAILIIGFFATAAALTTYRFGFDPDNLVNPLLSSSADLITTSLLVVSYMLIF